MQTININKKNADLLEILPLDSTIYNTEAKMLRFRYLDKDLVLKALHYSEGPIFANKLYTIEMLDTYRYSLPHSFCIPSHLVSVNKKVVGFALPFIHGENFMTLMRDHSISEEEKLYYYKRIGDILEQLRNIRKYTSLKDVYINDLHEGNIIINPNNKEVSLIDLDSCKIGTNCSFPSKYLSKGELLEDKPFKYKYNQDDNGSGYLIANENSDIYCYIVMLINYLIGDNLWRISKNEFLELLDYLSCIGFDKELLDCLHLLLENDKDNKNPRDYLDTLTPKQLTKARRFYVGRQ